MDVIEKKRKKLSRVYEIISQFNHQFSGYLPPHLHQSQFKCMLRVLEYQFLSHYFGRVPSWRLQLRKLAGRRTLPDFFLIGPIKGGTSDLTVNVLLHPNVMAPLCKEIGDPVPDNWRVFYPTRAQKARHALRHGVALSPYLGPFLHNTHLMRNFAKEKPQAKIVLVLRDPAQRFYSHWKWEVLLTGKARADENPFIKTFSTYVDESLDSYAARPIFSSCTFDGLTTSIYWHAVAGWIQCYGRENVMVIDAAEYFADANRCLNKIYEFVGLPAFEASLSKEKVLENPLTLPPPDDESMTKLKKFFAPHNEKLWDLIGERFNWA